MNSTASVQEADQLTATKFGCLLFVIIVLGGNLHIICHQVHRVEPDAKLPDQVDITTFLHLF